MRFSEFPRKTAHHTTDQPIGHMSQQPLLRHIPSYDRLSQDDKIRSLQQRYPHSIVLQWIRAATGDIRAEIDSGLIDRPTEITQKIISRICDREQLYRGSKIRSVINATGIILHTNLGRAPLSDRAIRRMMDAAKSANVELNLHTGKRNHRGQHCVEQLCQLTGCEDAVLVNNCAAATILVLQAVAAGKEVIISRGQLVEIGGGFRLPDVFRTAGVTIREVGTTNRTYVRDYESAMTESAAAVMRVHHSNYKLSGFVTEPSIAELVQMPHSPEIPIIDDLGSGWIGKQTGDSSQSAYPDRQSEPSISESISAGVDLTLFSGDKLLGGPQCGIVLGKKKWIEILRRHPLMRAMRLDKLTLAALEATLEIHLEGSAGSELPIMQMLHCDSEQIRTRCEQVAEIIKPVTPCKVLPCDSQLGGGSMPGQTLSSYAVQIRSKSVHRLSHQLRTGSPAVQGRIANDSILFDLRTVPDSHTEQLAMAIKEAILLDSTQKEAE